MHMEQEEWIIAAAVLMGNGRFKQKLEDITSLAFICDDFGSPAVNSILFDYALKDNKVNQETYEIVCEIYIQISEERIANPIPAALVARSVADVVIANNILDYEPIIEKAVRKYEKLLGFFGVE